MSSKVSCKSSTFSFANGSKLRSLESDFSEALHVHTLFLALKLGRNDLCIIINTFELNSVIVIEVLALKHHFIQNSQKM